MAENLTPMERKIIKKLKDTAKGKANVVPVRGAQSGAARSAKKVYSSTSFPRKQLNSAAGGRANKSGVK